MKKLLFCLAITAAAGLFAAPKVLVYMLDGARADALEAVNHPVWQALKANRWADGYKTAWSVTAGNEPFVVPASAPNHAVIATGKLAKHHKVFNNRTSSTRTSATPPPRPGRSASAASSPKPASYRRSAGPPT